MIWMISEGLNLSVFKSDPHLGWLAWQFHHMEWHGMTAWDLIQPFFMFIAGVAMPFSFSRRWAAGEPWSQSLRHVLKRCALLIFWGLVARSIGAGKPNLDLINVLAQLSFTYLVAFLLLRFDWKVQLSAGLGLLALHTAIYELATAPGVQGPWIQDANIGWWLDKTILGKNWGGSYATINCISSAFNTVAGMMAGSLLFGEGAVQKKLKTLIVIGAACIAIGLALDPVIPIIKKIWTASFAIYSLGFTLLALSVFYWICDVQLSRRWAQLLVIVGANSIFIYLFHECLHRWIDSSAKAFLGWTQPWLGPWTTILIGLAGVVFQIYVCIWLYRRQIFFKL